MATKNVRLDEDVYERIKARKRNDETFSEAIARLTSEYTAVDFFEGTDSMGLSDEELADWTEFDGLTATSPEAHRAGE
jgi:predicted CopG family antitoxin